MIPELGHYALILAFCVSLVQGILPLIGAHRQHSGWIALARPAAWALNVMLMFAFTCLTVAFIQNDFSVVYVVQHSNTLLPLPYRIAAVWGGHEGSLLLWAFMLGLWALAVALFSKHLPPIMVARVVGVLGLVTAGFLLFILASSNPFERLLPAVAEGRDLNPLLQDPGLIIHPPMLYMGYVGFSVAYAFAVAALLSGQLDTAWARWSRPWTTAAWIFLTLGIALGSWWSYYELGWGGWWFWDPVENASFMPWLVGTALMHSLAVTEKRGSFKNWTVLLAISAFSLSLLGTFLVRSGVLTSVHAFATDPRRGIFILAFLVIVIGSPNSSNSRRLKEVAVARGIDGYLIDGPDEIDPAWLQGRQRIGVTAGASAYFDTPTVGVGKVVTVGGLTLDVLETPGHSQGSVCLLVEGQRVIFAGDTLFRCSCGRCDFPGGDYRKMLASLGRLAALEGNLRVLPGHDRETTLDYERRVNPYMRQGAAR